MAFFDSWRRRPALAVALCIVALVAVRIAVIITSPLEIGPDESQYWRWSRTLDFGYYSKPPLIAWVIAATTAVFGQAEWAIRIASPVLHGIAAWCLFLLGRSQFDTRIGVWSSVVYFTMPGVWLSSTIMTTDAILLATWSASLCLLWRYRDAPSLANGVLAGAVIGLAVLAKYAALYLLAGAALAAIFDPQMRRAALSLSGAALLVAMLVVMSPNLIWNAAHNFATVSHTADNADLGEAGFSPLHVFNFLADQMGVFGPVTAILLFAGFAFIVGRKDKPTRERELWLLSFTIPPLLLILGQSIMSRAHANWAATAYPAASVLVASWIDRTFLNPGSRLKAGPVLKLGVALNIIIGVAFAIAWVAPSIGDAVGATNSYKRVRGWSQTAIELSQAAARAHATALMFDEREVWHGVDYYGRNIPGLPPIRAWRRGDQPRSHAEEAGAMRPGEDARVLVASNVPEFRAMIRADFASIEPAGYITVPLGPIKTRTLKLFIASGYHPQPRTAEFEKRFENQSED